MIENPDILQVLSNSESQRPRLIVGFAAETENIIANAKAKLTSKGCDWIVANNVSFNTGTFCGDTNKVHLVTASGVEEWPELSKADVGMRIAERIAETLEVIND